MSTTEAKPDPAAATTALRTGSLASRPVTERRDRLIDLAVITLPALLALTLCLYQLTTRSLWLDESATVAIASQHGGAFGAALAHDGGNMLAYYALVHVLIGWFGSGTLVLRLPAAIAAAATVALVSALALRLADRRIAMVAGVMSAVSLSLVYWGQDARGYTPMIALVAGSFLALITLLERRRAKAAWIAYVLCTAAAIYMGLEAVLVVPAQLLALIWFRHRWRAVVSAVALVAACSIPLAVLAASRGGGQLFWVPKPSARVLWQIVQALSSAGLQPSFYTSTTTALAVLTLVVLIWGAVSIWKAPPGASAWRSTLVLAWLLVPGLVALLESAIGQSIFQARYLLVSLPAVSLLIAWALGERRVWTASRWAGMLSLALLAAVSCLRAIQLGTAYGVSPEDWRGATRYVLTHAQPRDCIAFYPLDNRMAFRYYLRDLGRAPRPILPALPWHQVRPLIEDYSTLSPGRVAALPGECGRVWLIASHEGREGGPPVSHGNYLRFVRLTAGLRRGYPSVQSTSFGPGRVVTVSLYAR